MIGDLNRSAGPGQDGFSSGCEITNTTPWLAYLAGGPAPGYNKVEFSLID